VIRESGLTITELEWMAVRLGGN